MGMGKTDNAVFCSNIAAFESCFDQSCSWSLGLLQCLTSLLPYQCEIYHGTYMHNLLVITDLLKQTAPIMEH